MKHCDCGQSIPFVSFFPVCDVCLKAYLAELPHRPGFSIQDFRLERAQAATTESKAEAIAPQRVRLLQTSIDPVTYTQMMEQVERWVETGGAHQIVTVNVDFIRIAEENESFRRILNNSDLSIADGKPLLWAARWTAQELPARVTGMELVLGAAELAARRGEAIFLLGAAPGVAARAAAVLEQRYPGLTAYSYSPPMGAFSAEQDAEMVQMIRESGAKYLFVAFGAPRQDAWINYHLAELGVPVCAGIGGVLNFLTGDVKRAPDWVQRRGFEWLYRVVQEPRRLWRRYFLEDMPTFVRMLRGPIATAPIQRQVSRRVPATAPEYSAQPHALDLASTQS